MKNIILAKDVDVGGIYGRNSGHPDLSTFGWQYKYWPF